MAVTSGSASAPASSANLGPGFDCLGLAFELRCEVSATRSDSWIIHELGGSFEPGPRDYVRRAVTAAVGRPMQLSIENAVPRSRGLGSSAAVMAAAAAAAIRAEGIEPDSERLYEIVADIEGHGDNAGAAVYGGLVAVAGGTPRRMELAEELSFVFGIPDEPLKTEFARLALPENILRVAAARNLGRVAFLVEGLRTADPAAFAEAGGDEIHESHRAGLSPITGQMMDAALQAGALHAAWSGAGPTAIAIATEPEPVLAALGATLAGLGQAEVLPVAKLGWQ